MKVLVLEDEISHQVRMETTLAEIAKEMGISIKVKVTGKIREFKEYIEEEKEKGRAAADTASQSLCHYCFCYNEIRICYYDF